MICVIFKLRCMFFCVVDYKVIKLFNLEIEFVFWELKVFEIFYWNECNWCVEVGEIVWRF